MGLICGDLRGKGRARPKKKKFLLLMLPNSFFCFVSFVNFQHMFFFKCVVQKKK